MLDQSAPASRAKVQRQAEPGCKDRFCAWETNSTKKTHAGATRLSTKEKMKKLSSNCPGAGAAPHFKPTAPVLVVVLAGLINLAAVPGSSSAADRPYTFEVV